MRKEWTKKEEAYMKARYLTQPTEKTAKSLGRTVISVRRKAARMGLNHYTDNLNAKMIAKCFGCDISVVIRWINKLGLPAKKVKCRNQTRYLIDIDKFWEWAGDNRDQVNWARYEIDSLIPEPKWVKQEKESYNLRNSRKRFSDYEKQQIKSLLRQGKSYREISVLMGRSYYSINHIGRKIYS